MAPTEPVLTWPSASLCTANHQSYFFRPAGCSHAFRPAGVNGRFDNSTALVNTSALACITSRYETPHLTDLCIPQGLWIRLLGQFVQLLSDFRPHRTAHFLTAQPVHAVHELVEL